MTEKPTYEELNNRVQELEKKEAGLKRLEKELHECLRENESKYRHLVQTASDAIYLISEDGKILDANPAACFSLGWTKKEILQLDINGIDPGFTVEEFLSYWKKIPFNEPKVFETKHKRKDGSLVPIEISGQKFKLDQTIFYYGIARDITDRIRAEEELRESELFHKELFEKSPTALYLQNFSKVAERVDELKKAGVKNLSLYLKQNKAEVESLADSVVISQLNIAASNMYQANSKNGLLKIFKHRLDSGDMEHFIDQVVAFTDGEDWFEGDARNFDFQENTLEIILRKSVINRSENGLSKILVSVTDVTALHHFHREKVQLEKQLQQAQKMESIGNLAGGIAHDFNNILFPIIGMAEMLLEDFPSDGPEHEKLQAIYTSGLRGADLAKQILAFSRQSERKLIPVQIKQVLKEVMKLIRATIPSYIEIDENIQSDCGLLMANPTQIHQIAMNIITNAFHALEPKGGKITVQLKEVNPRTDKLPDSLHGEGQYVLLSISDTGHGISSDIMDKMFEPYFTTKEQGKGTGLGLAVAYGIIKEHKGEIKVDSEIGAGTTVRVYLPLIGKAVNTGKEEMIESDPEGNENILLVDDEETITKLEKQMLERLGYKVTSHINCLDALEVFKANPNFFDLLITDMNMPHMTGDQLAKKIKSIRPDFPVIICTGFSERLDKENAKAAGVNGFLMKPISKSTMSQMVRKVLDEAKNAI